MYDDILALKWSCNEAHQCSCLLKLGQSVDGELVDGNTVDVNGSVVSGVVLYGGASVGNSQDGIMISTGGHGVTDLSPSIEAIESFVSFIDSLSLPDPVSTDSLAEVERDSIYSFLSLIPLVALKAFLPPFSWPFDLSKPPSSYTEALAHLDALVWHLVMDRERQSLVDMGAFEEVELPKGERAIGLKWVYDIKTDATGA